jgi:hypothetical protein
LIDIGGFQQWISLQDSLPCFSTGQEFNDGGYRDPQPADARLSAHDGGIVGDAREVHFTHIQAV